MTNQATDDHLFPKPMAEVVPFESVAVRGTVTGAPSTITGGHVILEIGEGDHRLAAAAYEPTKGFRDLVRGLFPGDEVVAVGSVRDEPRTLNLEKLKVLSMATMFAEVRVGNPKCPDCGRSMKSVGMDAGYRCQRCGTRAGEEDAHIERHARDVSPGWYEVPPSARRHLARPLKLGVKPTIDIDL
jgi:tRNA(Ile2)-agmatinylcytidine synthase